MPISPVVTDPKSPVFDSPHDAARAVAALLGGKGGEQAVTIIKGTDGKYRHSTIAPGTDDNFQMRLQLQPGEVLAGIVHSHPGTDSLGKMFSPNDVDVADRLKVPSYVKFLGQQGALRVYSPGATKTRQMRNPEGYGAGSMRVADGDPVPVSEVPMVSPASSPASAAPSSSGLLSQAVK